MTASTGQGVSADEAAELEKFKLYRLACQLMPAAVMFGVPEPEELERLRQAIVTALTTLTAQVRADALEEAAQWLEQTATWAEQTEYGENAPIFRSHAKAIRALAPLPETKGGEG